MDDELNKLPGYLGIILTFAAQLSAENETSGPEEIAHEVAHEYDKFTSFREGDVSLMKVLRDIWQINGLCGDELDTYRQYASAGNYGEQTIEAVALRSLEQLIYDYLSGNLEIQEQQSIQRELLETLEEPQHELEVVRALETLVNRKNLNEPEIAQGVSRMHRYLQQHLFYQVIRPLIIGLAAQGIDKRNESSVRSARQIVEECDWYPEHYGVDSTKASGSA